MDVRFKNIFLILSIFFSNSLFALSDYYKNIHVGGKAATMGGAYTAISNDASGAYYNPAGLALASSDSISTGISIYNSSQSKIKDVFDNYDWERSSSNVVPNFLGVVKKHKNYSFGISYVTSDQEAENQNQIFHNITNVINPVDVYSYKLHSDDTTSLFGISYALKLSERISVGVSTYYHHNSFNRQLHQHIEFEDGLEELSYSNYQKNENGIRTKFGAIYNASEKYSFGITLGKTFITNEDTSWQTSNTTRTNTNATFSSGTLDTITNYPIEASFGFAYSYNPSLRVSCDIDYIYALEAFDKDVINGAIGIEYSLTLSDIIRFGIYSNMTNNPTVSTETAAPNNDLNMYGITLGHTHNLTESSFTIGGIYSIGSGQMQVYSGSSTSRDIEKTSFSIIASADMNF